ncbi:MAG: cupin domain-containing protein [Pyrinomonadaceae bacterium]|nr:cupin domain-containing protein [Pyrinomonadaceae bacterium]
MAVVLEGGCRVTGIRDGEPTINGTLSVWPQIGRANKASAISLRTMEFAPGLSPGFRNQECDEIAYVLQGAATILIDGWPYPVQPETGVYLRPGAILTLDNPGPESFVLISSQCPEPVATCDPLPPLTSPRSLEKPSQLPPIVRLADRDAVPTADRWYRVLVDEEVGSTQVTQFVGSIPPGRAPDHFHNYEEVLFILRGVGRMWAGKTHTPIAPGSCIYLPKGQVHCVENTGDSELRLLGVFYPAGSPSVRYEA